MSGGIVNVGGWRLPLRLARRETRRRPGRTILVGLLVAIPVMAMTLGSIWSRTADTDPSFEFGLQYGGADISVVGGGAASRNLDELLPTDSAVTRLEAGSYLPIGVRGDARLVHAMVVGLPDDRPDSLERWGIGRGDVPGNGEVWASDRFVERFDLDVGDTLDLDYPRGSWTISGSGRPASDHDADVLVFGELPTEQFTDDALAPVALIDLPDETDAVRVETAGKIRAAAPESFVDTVEQRIAERANDPDDQRNRLAAGWIAGSLALAALGIVISAAFATSARRQLVTVGQLSANGAPQLVIGRSLALQGFWTGLAGAALGLAGGLGAATAGRSTIERLAGSDLPATEIAALDLIVIGATGVLAAVLAAWHPARSAAKVPTLTALAGRRPVGAVPARLVPIGLGLFAIGVVLLGLAAGDSTSGDGNGRAAAAVGGGRDGDDRHVLLLAPGDRRD